MDEYSEKHRRHPKLALHSYRNATSGSTFEGRRAGTKLATAATELRTTATSNRSPRRWVRCRIASPGKQPAFDAMHATRKTAMLRKTSPDTRVMMIASLEPMVI